jgi:hypothetical protein
MFSLDDFVVVIVGALGGMFLTIAVAQRGQ